MATPRKKQVDEFLAQQVLTAPKEQLLLMLVDGAVKFAERGKIRLASNDFEGFGTSLIRAQRIMLELICSLRKDLIGETLYTNLVGLYHFTYTRLVDASLKRDVVPLDEALKVLHTIRDMWHEAVEKDRQERQGPPAPRAVAPAQPKPPSGGLSITG